MLAILSFVLLLVAHDSTAASNAVDALPLISFNHNDNIYQTVSLNAETTWQRILLDTRNQFTVLKLHVSRDDAQLSANVPGIGFELNSVPSFHANLIDGNIQMLTIKPNATAICFFEAVPCVILLKIQCRSHDFFRHDVLLTGWTGEVLKLDQMNNFSLERGLKMHLAVEAPKQKRPVLLQVWPDQSKLLADVDLEVFSECNMNSPIFPNNDNTNRVYNLPEGVTIDQDMCGSTFYFDVRARRRATLTFNEFTVLTVTHYSTWKRFVTTIFSCSLFASIVCFCTWMYFDILGSMFDSSIRQRTLLLARRISKRALASQSLILFDAKLHHVKSCVICLEKFKQYELLCLLDCGHSYHVPCVTQWLVRSKACPLCKQIVGTGKNLHRKHCEIKIHRDNVSSSSTTTTRMLLKALSKDTLPAQNHTMH